MAHPSFLLCDDEIHILRAAEFKLQARRLRPLSARNGLEAWEEIQRRMPDVLITDWSDAAARWPWDVQKDRENPQQRPAGVHLTRQRIRTFAS